MDRLENLRGRERGWPGFVGGGGTNPEMSAVQGVDTIVDFSRFQGDTINLVNIDADAGKGGNQAFNFIGTGAFTHVAGELHYVNDGFQTTLSGDVNGDAVADFTIILSGAPGLINTDFML
jgi:hypothetical protein